MRSFGDVVRDLIKTSLYLIVSFSLCVVIIGCNESGPRFCYAQEVDIIGGFYRGNTGTIEDYNQFNGQYSILMKESLQEEVIKINCNEFDLREHVVDEIEHDSKEDC